MGFLTKHFLIPVLFLVCTTVLPGQEETTDLDQSKISVGVHLGAAISNINTSQLAFPVSQTTLNGFEQKRPINERIGIQVLFHFGKLFGLESGLFYEKNGIKTKGAYDPVTNTVNLESDASSRYTYEYFTVPVLFKKLFNTEEPIQFSLHFGPYFGFLQAAKYSFKTSVLKANPDGTIFRSSRDESFHIKHLTRDTDIGLRCRVGAERNISELATLFAYAFYAKSLTHVEDFPTNNVAEISDGKHVVYGLTIGGYFRML